MVRSPPFRIREHFRWLHLKFQTQLPTTVPTIVNCLARARQSVNVSGDGYLPQICPANLHLTTAHYRRISGSLQTHYRRTIDALQTQNLIDAIFENAYRHIIAAVLPQHRRNIDALQPHQRRNQTLYSSTKATILKQYRRSIDVVQQQHSRIIDSSRFFQTQFFYRRT